MALATGSYGAALAIVVDPEVARLTDLTGCADRDPVPGVRLLRRRRDHQIPAGHGHRECEDQAHSSTVVEKTVKSGIDSRLRQIATAYWEALWPPRCISMSIPSTPCSMAPARSTAWPPARP